MKVGRELLVQVNLFQKASFLHQVTHNMTRDCSLNSPKKFRTCCVQKLVFVLTFKTIFVHNLSELVFFREFNEQSLVLFWVNWFKNERFWHKLTLNQKIYINLGFADWKSSMFPWSLFMAFNERVRNKHGNKKSSWVF